MIAFVPRRGQVLMCNFDMTSSVPPEMCKKRRVVVVSPRSHNHRHGAKPGHCLVVPFSATSPILVTAAEVAFPAGRYRSLTVPTWALCGMVQSMSHARLDRVAAGRIFLSECLSANDLARIEAGLLHALGLDRHPAEAHIEPHPFGDLRGSVSMAVP